MGASQSLDFALRWWPRSLSPFSPAVAVANVLGSNIFNILVGLGLPWLLKSLVTGEPCVLPALREA